MGTINHGLQVVRRIMNLAAGEWVDDHGLTWLHAAPKTKLLMVLKSLFAEMKDRVEFRFVDMAMFAVNTGCRDAEICQLRWEWKLKFPHYRLQFSSFLATLLSTGRNVLSF